MRWPVTTVFLLGTASATHAQAPSELRHNPFARPDMAPVANASTDASGGWPEALRATLVDGERSLANIDGVLVSIGDKVDGATVSEIGEGVVTLVRGDTSRVLRLEDNASTDTRRRERE